MRGYYKGIKLDYPYTLGLEGSSTVVEAGPGIMYKISTGERVAFMKALKKPPI